MTAAEQPNTNSKRVGPLLRPSKPALRAAHRRMEAIIRWQEERDEKLRAWHDGGPAPWEADALGSTS